MKRNRAAAVAGALVASLLAGEARANGIASLVADRSGNVYFSDYIRNRIWKVAPDGVLSAWVRGKHTHHLVIDDNGVLYGEHVPPGGGTPELWEATPKGRVNDIFRAARKGHSVTYRGTVFAIDRSGTLLYLRDCQLVKLSADGQISSRAGQRCAGDVWKNDILRYGHLHGSLVWGPDGSLYFSDARSVRRVAPDGRVTTLDGRPVGLFADPEPGEARFGRAVGLVVDSERRILVADSRDRTVKRVEPEGRTITVARLPFFWSPTGLGLSGDTVYVVANLRVPTPGFLAGVVGNPSVFAVTRDGKISTLATVRGKR